MKTIKLNDRVTWCGVLDKDLRTFDIVMHTDFGTTYNSYLVRGDSATAIIDASKETFTDEWIDKVSELIGGGKVDYLIANHTEPDHSGAVAAFAEKYPDIKIYCTTAAKNFLADIANKPLNTVVVKDGQTLDLGCATLQFISAPNLHWPDTMYTYLPEEKTLFTCDSFGSHYACDEMLASAVPSVDDYKSATENYFVNILGPFKTPFLANAIKKVGTLDVDTICPGHGPILDGRESIDRLLGWYGKWMAPAAASDKKQTVIAYVSAYGYTASLAARIATGIADSGCDVKSYDLTGKPEIMGEATAAIAAADGFLVGSPTILGEALKPIWDIVTSMTNVTHKGKYAAAFGSYGWTGEAVPNLTERLKQLKLNVVSDGLRVKFKPTDTDLDAAYELGYDFGCAVQKKPNDRKPAEA